MLQDEVAYATEEVERLTKVLDEQNCLLRASQEQAAQKDVTIEKLTQKVTFRVLTGEEKGWVGRNRNSPQFFFSTSCKNNKTLWRKLSEMELSDLWLRIWSHRSHCLGWDITVRLCRLRGSPLGRGLTFDPLFVKTPRTPGSISRNLTQVLESQERELENRRSSMMTMEVLLAELNAERAAKNEEIQRLKVMCSFFIFNYNRLKVGALAVLITCFGADRKPSKKLNSCVILSPQTQLTEKEMVRMEIQALLDKFYTKQNSLGGNGKNKWGSFYLVVYTYSICVYTHTYICIYIYMYYYLLYLQQVS